MLGGLAARSQNCVADSKNKCIEILGSISSIDLSWFTGADLGEIISFFALVLTALIAWDARRRSIRTENRQNEEKRKSAKFRENQLMREQLEAKVDKLSLIHI